MTHSRLIEDMRDAVAYAAGLDVAGWEPHMRYSEIAERFDVAARELVEQFESLEDELRNLEAESRRYYDHADATDDEGGHVGEATYYRTRAEMIGRAVSRIRTALSNPAKRPGDGS